jgi:hypothetical protein
MHPSSFRGIFNKKTMRLRNALLASCFLITLVAVGQYSDIVRVAINEAAVPETVQQAQQWQFPDGFVTGWKYHSLQQDIEDDTTYYMASFKRGGRPGNYAYFSADGTLLAYSLYVSSDDLPAGIQENAGRKLNGSVIKSAELIDLENPKRQLYRVRLNSDGLLKYIYFDMNGNLLERATLPSKIFVFI